jgi:hypothetical protein
MALRMVALIRIADGRLVARKGIPEDVRDEYARLYGLRREAHLRLPADTARHEAKTRLGEWEAEIETRIATLRAKKNGKGQPLTRLNAIALAGRWVHMVRRPARERARSSQALAEDERPSRVERNPPRGTRQLPRKP